VVSSPHVSGPPVFRFGLIILQRLGLPTNRSSVDAEPECFLSRPNRLPFASAISSDPDADTVASRAHQGPALKRSETLCPAGTGRTCPFTAVGSDRGRAAAGRPGWTTLREASPHGVVQKPLAHEHGGSSQ